MATSHLTRDFFDDPTFVNPIQALARKHPRRTHGAVGAESAAMLLRGLVAPSRLRHPGGCAFARTKATMSRVIGLDGVNRLLHGEGNPDGWVAGANVLVLDGPTQSPLEVLNGADDSNGPFKGLSLLDAIRLDGVVKSNDEPYAFTSSGSRDAVVFNNVIQGPTIVNNGFLLYDSRGNPGYGATNGPTSGATPLRTVEAYPRGSIEGGYNIGGAGNQVGYPSRVGSGWLDGKRSQYDYVATFTGTYSTYPAQMFDRNVQPMNTLYLGLRAYKMSSTMMAKVRKDADEAEGSAGLEGSGKVAYFFQIVPFSSRKAYLCQHVQDVLSAEKDRLMEAEINAVRDRDPRATLAFARKVAGEEITNDQPDKASAIKEALQKKARTRSMETSRCRSRMLRSSQVRSWCG